MVSLWSLWIQYGGDITSTWRQSKVELMRPTTIMFHASHALTSKYWLSFWVPFNYWKSLWYSHYLLASWVWLFNGNKFEAFIFKPCLNVSDHTTISAFVVDIFPTHVASGIHSNFFIIYRFGIALGIYMEELTLWRLCLAYPMNLLRQPIHRRFRVKWSRFWLAILLNFSTKPINHIKIKVNRRSASK